jgi:hypothetical protein
LFAVFLIFPLPFASALSAVSLVETEAAQVTDNAAQRELLRAIVVHNTAARERLKSWIIELECVRESVWRPEDFDLPSDVPKGLRIDTRRGVWISDGLRFRIDSTCVTEVREADFRRETREQAVLSDRFFAEIAPNTPNRINCLEHLSISAMPETTRQYAEGCLLPDFRKYGFGTGDAYLSDLISFDKVPSPWSVREEAGPDGPVYRLTRLLRSKDGLRVGRTEIVVDPHKDFLITAVRDWQTNGPLRLETNITLNQLDDGRWFPGDVTEIRHEDGVKFRLIVRNAKVNVPVPDREFTLEALDFDKSRTVLYRLPKGAQQFVQTLYREGQWVSVNALPPNLR